MNIFGQDEFITKLQNAKSEEEVYQLFVTVEMEEEL